MNSSEASRSFADFFASATRCLGLPCEPASPWEQMTKWAGRPRKVSFATTPPQANSMSSGCAPKASNGRRSVCDFGIGFIGTVNRIAAEVSDFRRFIASQVLLFARAGDVMRTMQDGLHPAQPRVARGADVLLGEIHWRQNLV